MATMYETTVQVNKDTVTVVKAESDIFRRPLEIVEGKLTLEASSSMNFPLYLTNKKLNTITKADLANILTSIEVNKSFPAAAVQLSF